MNSIEVSSLFPSGTVVVAYKGKTLGGAKVMPQWEIEPLIDESQYFRSADEILADLRVKNSISLEFDAVDPQNIIKLYDFDDSPGLLSFVPLDPERKVAYHFHSAELKDKPEINERPKVHWRFEILCDDNGVFMQKIKAN